VAQQGQSLKRGLGLLVVSQMMASEEAPAEAGAAVAVAEEAEVAGTMVGPSEEVVARVGPEVENGLASHSRRSRCHMRRLNILPQAHHHHSRRQTGGGSSGGMPEDSGPADRCRRGWCSRDRWWHTRSTDPPTDPARRASLHTAPPRHLWPQCRSWVVPVVVLLGAEVLVAEEAPLVAKVALKGAAALEKEAEEAAVQRRMRWQHPPVQCLTAQSGLALPQI
jgi:hypothetical protein